MRKTNAFTPTVADTLETRSVPSSIGFATSHAFVFTSGALSTPVVHPANTFSNGVPTVHVATDGERFTLGSAVKTAPTSIVAIPRPAATTASPAASVPVVVHPPGTFSNGNPTVHVAADGERFTLGGHLGR